MPVNEIFKKTSGSNWPKTRPKATYEHYVDERGLQHLGKKRWRHRVTKVVEDLRNALEPTDVVIGGRNAKKLKAAPKGARIGDNANAFSGGFILWTGNEFIQLASLPTYGAGRAPEAVPVPAGVDPEQKPSDPSGG